MSAEVQRWIDDGALEDAARALEEKPDARLMLRLAAALHDRGEAQAAEAWYRRILELDPANADALLCLAVMREDSDIAEARELMNAYIARKPEAAGRLRRALMLPAIAESAEHIDEVTRRLERDLDELAEMRLPPIRQPEFEVGATPFFLAYYGRNPKPLLEKVARACRAVYPTETGCRRKPFANGPRLRVGFISAYFHEHSVTRALHGLIRDLPRERFETRVFAVAPRADEWNRIVRASAEGYVELPLDLERVRRALTEASLDIAFFMDIGMDPLTYFLAFWRVAPLQVTTWGHSVTTGIDTIDYYVSHDPVELPDAQAHYSEKLIRLPGYFMPRYLKPALKKRKSRAELGLPADRRLYYCPQNLFKLHPDFDTALRSILERDDAAEIVLVDSGKPWTGLLGRRLQRTLGDAVARVRVVPRMQHQEFLQHLAAADVVLDPFYFGGCNSSCDAFSLAAPIATLPGFLLPGRFTLGLYEEMGIGGAVAQSPEEYVEIALRLARDGASMRREIAARNGRLYDRPDTGRALGDALLEIAESG